jgi:hypothetical protein
VLRVRTAAVVAIVTALLCAGSSQAVTIVMWNGQAPRPFQKWARAMRVPTFHGTVTLHRTSECASCAQGSNIWLDPHYYSRYERDTREALYHELGHVFDYFQMTDADRAAFEETTGDHRPWRTSYDSPHEQFAEAYAFCALPPKWLSWRRVETGKRGYALTVGYKDGANWSSADYGYRPSRSQFRRACKAIRRMG